MMQHMATSPAGKRYERFRSVEAAAVAGIAFAVFYIVSLVLLRRQPGPEADLAELADFYGDEGNRSLVILGLNLAVFSAIAFLWFIAVIRRRIGDREDRFFATVFLGSGLLFLGSMLVGAASYSSGVVTMELLGGTTPGAAAVGFGTGLASGLTLVVVPRLTAVFVLTTSTLVLRSGRIQRWVAILGYIVAVLLFVVPLFLQPLGYLFAVWVAVVSGALLVRDSRPDDSAEEAEPG